MALLNREDRHHEALLERYRSGPSHWVLPGATLPEIDYLVERAGGASTRLTGRIEARAIATKVIP